MMIYMMIRFLIKYNIIHILTTNLIVFHSLKSTYWKGFFLF